MSIKCVSMRVKEVKDNCKYRVRMWFVEIILNDSFKCSSVLRGSDFQRGLTSH